LPVSADRFTVDNPYFTITVAGTRAAHKKDRLEDE
jgi:hypothetical protein